MTSNQQMIIFYVKSSGSRGRSDEFKFTFLSSDESILCFFPSDGKESQMMLSSDDVDDMINSTISWNWSANQNQGNFKVKNVVEYLNYYPAKKSRENTISKIDTCGVIMLFCIFCGNNGGICQNTIWGVIAVFIRLIKIVNPSSSFLKLKDGIKVSFPPVQNVWRFNESCVIMCMIFQKFKAHWDNYGSRCR